MSYRKQAMQALSDGAATSAEVASRLGVSQRIASAILCRMYREGRIDRSPEQVRSGARGGWEYGRKVKAQWTLGEIRALKDMAGVRINTAARRLGRTNASVANQARRYGVELRGRRVKYWSPADGVAVARLRADGLTYRQIKEQTGVPLGTLREWLA